ncbi:MAG: Hsp20/alpha crystallin family protein [Candidatus Altiarchaeota archaeon]|nr:Hsp20/alpha crystallin family protein [Candidatus Altiarchaeota archaeon]
MPAERRDAGEWMGGECLEPLCYVGDGGDRFFISMELPLVEKKDIELSFAGSELEIRAKMRKTLTLKSFGAFGRLSGFCSFGRRIRLPQDADPGNARARFVKGILEIEVPRKRGAGLSIE